MGVICIKEAKPENSFDPGDGITLINQALKNKGYEEKGDLTFAYERSFQEILSFFIEPKHSKILYTLNLVHVSSAWELHNLFQLGYTQDIQRWIADFEKFSIVRQIQKKDADYQIIREFWEREYVNTPRTRPSKLYMVTEHYKPVIEIFSPIIFRKYIWKSEFVKISRRSESYEAFYQSACKNLGQKSANVLARCISCKSTILKTHKRSVDYHVFPQGHVCAQCWNTSSKEQIRKWMQSNK